MFWGLHSNSVLCRQESDLVGWFDSATESNVHYIPILADLSDLVEKLNWAMRNDEDVRHMSKRAQKFANQLSQEKILGFIKFYLASYARLFH